jgi:hypothetical protein
MKRRGSHDETDFVLWRLPDLGWVATADGAPTTRYPYSQRWTGSLFPTLDGRDGRQARQRLSVIATDGVDGIHFSAQNNLDLGQALADKVADIFARPAG